MPAMPDTFHTGLQLVGRHSDPEGRPAEFDLLGRTWDLLPGVFAPVYTGSTEAFTTWLPYPEGGTFLEIGSGTGVTAVVAALNGCAGVTALDLTEPAVRNTQLNVARHRVQDRVRVLRSDLFSALLPDSRFDMIFWNSNVIEAPEAFSYTDEIQPAIFDPGYNAHARYLRQAEQHLTENGRLFLGFNTLGNYNRLDALATSVGLRTRTSNRLTHRAGNVTVDFLLLELLPVRPRPE
jgi:release factor glutamine methyltransferase